MSKVLKEITLLSVQEQFIDNFDNSSIDATHWGTAVAGAGTIVETTELVQTTTDISHASMIYSKDVYNPFIPSIRSMRARASVLPSPRVLYFMQMTYEPSTPSPDIGSVVWNKGLFELYQRYDGSFALTWRNEEQYDTGWNGSSHIWTPGVVGNAYLGSINTIYRIALESDGERWRFKFYNSSEVLLEQTSWVLWSTVLRSKASMPRYPLYMIWGDHITNSVQGTLNTTNYQHYNYTNKGWVDVTSLERITVDVLGTFSGTLRLFGSCEHDMPAEYGGRQIGGDITSPTLYEISSKLRWLSVRLPIYTSGSLDVHVVGNETIYGM